LLFSLSSLVSGILRSSFFSSGSFFSSLLLGLFLSLLVSLTLGGDGLGGGLVGGLFEGLIEEIQLGGLGLSNLEGTFGTRETLELLPVAGDLEEIQHSIGGLSANTEPVLDTFGINLDDAGLALRVVLTDGLDGAARTTGTGIRNDNTVLGGANLAETHKLNLDSHERLLFCVTGECSDTGSVSGFPPRVGVTVGRRIWKVQPLAETGSDALFRSLLTNVDQALILPEMDTRRKFAV